MRKFKDTQDREWYIKLTLGSAKRVLDETGQDLLNVTGDEGSLMTLLEQDILMGSVIACLLGPQFEERGMGADDVEDTFDGPTLLKSQKAFMEEWADFSKGRGRADSSALIRKMQELVEAGIAREAQNLEKIDTEKTLEELEALTSGTGPGSQQENSDSTPDPSPTEN